jgi:hypothetical protein
MENKQTLEEAVANSWLDYEHVEGHLYSTTYRAGFEAGAEWQAERMYSEEEVLNILHNYRNYFELHRNLEVLPNMFFKWFEQFKKTKDEKERNT